MNENYIDFLKESFPKLTLQQSDDLKKIYMKICENNILSDYFRSQLTGKYEKVKIEYLDYYRSQLNKILIYIGINEENIINFCFRASTEYILKLLYSMKNDNDISAIDKKSFRFLSDDLKNKDEELYKDMVQDIAKLLSDYGHFSNKIHGKLNDKNELQYMNEILTGSNIDFSRTFRQLTNIVDVYEKILIRSLKINKKNIDASLIFRLENLISNNRISKLLSYEE